MLRTPRARKARATRLLAVAALAGALLIALTTVFGMPGFVAYLLVGGGYVGLRLRSS